MSQFHRDAPLGDIHKLHQWVYADSTARLAATPAADDVGKVALQSDTSEFYILTDDSPATWQLISSGSVISDTAYNATTWNGDTTHAPSKNAVRDQVETMQTDINTRALASDLTTHTGATAAHGATGAVMGTTNVQVVSNKSIDAASNTLTNIANAEIKAAAAIALNKLAATTVSRALVSDASGFVSPATTTSTEIGYVNGVTSAIQTQLNTKITASSTDALTNKTFDADGAGNSITNIENADIKAAAAIALNKLAATTASRVLVSDGSGFVSASSVTSTEVGLLSGVTGTLATIAGTQTLTNKDVDGGTASNARRITLPKDTLANLTALTRKEGTLVYATDQAKPYFDNGSALTAVGSGSGAGGINYVSSNPDAETDTTGWTTYDDANGGTPTDLTGTVTAITATWTRSTSSPLRGNANFLYTSGAIGNGVAYTITPDRADVKRGSVLAITLEAETSGTTTEGAYQLWVYDVANSALIQPAGYKIPGSVSGAAFKHQATFQIPTNGTTFRVAIHQSVGSPGGNLKVDTVSVGPQSLAYGAPVTDWDTTRTFSYDGLGTVGASYVSSRRVGDTLEVVGYVTAGTVAASTFAITLPVTIDSAKMTSASSVQVVGLLVRENGVGLTSQYAGNAQGPFPLFYDGSTTNKIYMASGTSSSNFAKAVGTTKFSNSDPLTFKFAVPVSGWSSSVVMSDSADTRQVAAIISGDPASATVGNPIIVPTVGYDSHGAYSNSTGRYTVAVPGLYQMFGALQSASAATTLSIYKNAVSSQLAGNLDSNGEGTFSGMVNCIAGDLIDIRPGGTVDATSMSLNIVRVSGPTTIAASESVNLKYEDVSGTSVTSSTATVKYGTKKYDTHGCYDTSTGIFTCRVQGKYRFTVFVYTQSVNNSTSQALEGFFKVTSTPESLTASQELLAVTWGIGSARTAQMNYTKTYSLNVGDTVEVQLDSANTVALGTTAGRNYFSAERVGN